MKRLQEALATIALAAVIIRIAADILAPALPLLVTLLVIVFLSRFILGGRGL